MAQKVKLSTIAESLGLSTATISLALRDSPLVAGDTREKIKEQARALGPAVFDAALDRAECTQQAPRRDELPQGHLGHLALRR